MNQPDEQDEDKRRVASATNEELAVLARGTGRLAMKARNEARRRFRELRKEGGVK